MYRLGMWLVLAVVVPVAIALVLVPTREQMTSANLALVMLVGAVGVAAASNSVVVSVLCAGVTGLTYDFFLVRPYFSVTIAEPAEALTSVLVLVVVAVVGSASSLFRKQRSLTQRREESLGLLYQLIEQVAGVAGERALIETSEREIGVLLGGATCRYAAEMVDPDAAQDSSGAHIDQIGQVRIGEAVWDTALLGLPDRPLTLTVQSGGLRFGAFLLDPVAGKTVAQWELIVAVMIADLVGAALARWPSES